MDHHALEEEVYVGIVFMLSSMQDIVEQFNIIRGTIRVERTQGAAAIRNLKLSDRRSNVSIRPRSAALENPTN